MTGYEPLQISLARAHDDLLDELEALAPGTVLELLVDKVDGSVLAITAGGRALPSFDAARIAHAVNNRMGVVWGVFCLACAGYFGWCVVIAWRYRPVKA